LVRLVTIPPTRPQPWLDPDPLEVEPEPVEVEDENAVLLRRLDAWQEGDNAGPLIRWAAAHLRGEPPLDRPAPTWLAWLGLGVCIGIVLFALVVTIVRAMDAAPSSGQTTDPVDLSGTSSAAQSGAPHTAIRQVGAGIETRPLQRPGDSGLGRADVSAEARQARDLSRWQLVPILPRDATGGTPQPAVPHGASEPIASMPALITGLSAGPYQSDVGTALIGGWATYYATCAECAAAGPLLREALGPRWKGSWITVVSDHGRALVRLETSCACRDRHGQPTVIDVSIEAFDELSPIPAKADADPGLVAVSIELVPALPATDADERMRLEVRGDQLYTGGEP
jgi:hypothetical protein